MHISCECCFFVSPYYLNKCRWVAHGGESIIEFPEMQEMGQSSAQLLEITEWFLQWIQRDVLVGWMSHPWNTLADIIGKTWKCSCVSQLSRNPCYHWCTHWKYSWIGMAFSENLDAEHACMDFSTSSNFCLMSQSPGEANSPLVLFKL